MNTLKAIILTSLLIFSAGANALVVSVDGTAYNLTVITGSYDSMSELVQEQIWWGDEALAKSLAAEVNFNLGVWPPFPSTSVTALFAWSDASDPGFFVAGAWSNLFGFPQGRVLTFNWPKDATISPFVVASEVPLPAAAWLFGSALFGLGAIKQKKTA